MSEQASPSDLNSSDAKPDLHRALRPSEASGSETKAGQANDADGSTTEAYLEKLSLQFVDALNDRSWEQHSVIAEHASPLFTGDLDTGSRSASELLESLKFIAEKFPQMAIRVQSCKAYVYPKLSKADVYMNMETVGHPPGVVREGFCHLEWELEDGKWMCVRHKGFPGWGNLGAEGV